MGLISVMWRCKPANEEMNKCLGQFTTDEERDRLRDLKLKKKSEWRAKQRALQAQQQLQPK